MPSALGRREATARPHRGVENAQSVEAFIHRSYCAAIRFGIARSFVRGLRTLALVA